MTCPECGAPMDIDRCCIIEERVLPAFAIRGQDHHLTRQRLAAAGLCTACECCIELTRDQLQQDARSTHTS